MRFLEYMGFVLAVFPLKCGFIIVQDIIILFGITSMHFWITVNVMGSCFDNKLVFVSNNQIFPSLIWLDLCMQILL